MVPPFFFVSSLLDIFVTVFPHMFVVAVSDPTFVMQYLLCFLTTISNPASDISLYHNFLNKGPLPIINQTKLVCLYTFILKSTGIAFKLSKRQNTDQSFYIIIHVSQAFGSVSINKIRWATGQYIEHVIQRKYFFLHMTSSGNWTHNPWIFKARVGHFTTQDCTPPGYAIMEELNCFIKIHFTPQNKSSLP